MHILQQQEEKQTNANDTL